MSSGHSLNTHVFAFKFQFDPKLGLTSVINSFLCRPHHQGNNSPLAHSPACNYAYFMFAAALSFR